VTAVFVDTSALFALLDGKDANHARAKRAFANLRTRQAALVSTSFVLVETYALVVRRLGLDAVRSVREDVAPLVDVVWQESAPHRHQSLQEPQ
jgi:uncharacterized protein